MLARDPEIRRALIDEAIAATAGDMAALHELHEAQVWRAAYWRAAREGLTYRRFFEIADLVGVRVERPRVFDDVHALLKRARRGGAGGRRAASTTSTASPIRRSYLERLQETLGGENEAYLLVEKILEPGETLRPSWPVAGTTGYEFIEALAGLFVDPAGASGADGGLREHSSAAGRLRGDGARDEAAHRSPATSPASWSS